MQHLRIVFLLFMLNTFLTLTAQSLPIIPQPSQVKITAGYFSFKAKPKIIPPQNLQLKSAALIQAWANSTYADTIPSKNAPRIILGLFDQDSTIQALCKQRQIRLDTLGEEAYHVLIEPELVLLVAKEEPGLLYAVQSLLQLLQANQEKKQLPCVKIYDAPAFAHRAIMDDISRGPISNMDFIKTQIRRLSALKINALSFYIEHVVKTKKHPSFAPEDAITIAEFEELSAYAKPYHVELIGSFQSLGHYRNILGTPDYAYLAETDRMLKPADPQSYKFLTEVYSEMIPAFSSKFFNINADEAYDLNQGRLTPLADSLGTGTLFLNHVTPLLDFIEAKDKKPMLWGDMLLAHPEVIPQLPKSSTILSWEYGDQDSFAPWIDPFQEAGLDFWVCPGIVNSNKIMPDYEVSVKNIQNFIQEGFEKGAKGVMTTIWDDGGGHLFAKDWYGVAYAADQSWHPSQNQLSFENRYSNLYYADTTHAFPRLIKRLNSLKELRSTQELNTAFLDQRVVPDVGESLSIYIGEWSELLEVCDDSRDLLAYLQLQTEKNNIRSGSEDLLYWKFLIKQLYAVSFDYAALGNLLISYWRTQRFQNDGNPLFKEKLDDIRYSAKNLTIQWDSLKEAYTNIWFQENRTYSLAEATGKFDRKIQAYNSLVQLLTDINPNHPLPEPKDLQLESLYTYEQYFSFWLISPVFIINKDDKWSDYLGDLGGEAKAQPTPYDWLKYQSPFTDKMEVNRARDFQESSVLYAYCKIESQKAQKVKAEIEFPGAFQVILNGKPLKKVSAKGKSIRKAIVRQKLNLQAGQNHIILKMLAEPKDAVFTFQILDTEIRNRKHRYRILETK